MAHNVKSDITLVMLKEGTIIEINGSCQNMIFYKLRQRFLSKLN